MPHAIVTELIDLLQLERLEENLFRGQSRDIGTRFVFGGQVLGQALAAAQRTVEGRDVHSMHAYFLRAGDVEAPIVYEVDRSRDGKSFSSRRVVAIQHGQPILNMAASFQEPEDGLTHQVSMPDVPPPEDLAEPEPVNPETLAKVPPKLPALGHESRTVRVSPRLSARRVQAAEATAVPARLVPAGRPHPGRSIAASRAARLCVPTFT